jgi:hypothetical protein
MTFEIASALLNRASNGNELLSILESIASDEQDQDQGQEIQF